jgi:hypothetical protein
MLRRVGQYAEVQILRHAACVRFRQSNLAASRIDSEFGKGNALSSRMFLAFCKGVVARFVSRCGDSAAKDQNDPVQEQPHLVPSFDEGVELVVRHGLPPFRFEHLSLAVEGSD